MTISKSHQTLKLLIIYTYIYIYRYEHLPIFKLIHHRTADIFADKVVFRPNFKTLKFIGDIIGVLFKKKIISKSHKNHIFWIKTEPNINFCLGIIFFPTNLVLSSYFDIFLNKISLKRKIVEKSLQQTTKTQDGVNTRTSIFQKIGDFDSQ